MWRLQSWQWIILGTPIAGVILFIIIAAGQQIHEWGLNWIWGVFTLILLGWRWLFVNWTKPTSIPQVETVLGEINQELEELTTNISSDRTREITDILENVLTKSINDRPIWEDWGTFWQRCLELITAIAGIYHPEVKYPLLNIYVTQAYGLIRGTMDDMDRMMEQLAPALNNVSIGQAYQAYETYQKIEPSARKLLQVWGWVRWLINPIAAAANQISQKSTQAANERLLGNFNQIIREAALTNLCKQSVALYGGTYQPIEIIQKELPNTQTLRQILDTTQPETIEKQPVNILIVGSTGAGKSSLINTLFQANLAKVDVLPSTSEIQDYQWQLDGGEILNIWDSPGYEQIGKESLKQEVLNYCHRADLLILVTNALSAGLEIDRHFLMDVRKQVEDLPIITVVSGVDRLRPIKEWNPPYNWQWGERPKEKAIREATNYRQDVLGEFCDFVLPLVNGDVINNREEWNSTELAQILIQRINPTKQLRLARFYRNLDTRAIAAATIISRYSLQMSTTAGLTKLVKSPILQLISTWTTGTPTLAYLLSEQIPVEQLPRSKCDRLGQYLSRILDR